MKKILTLLLSIGLFSASFAQSNHRNDHDYNKDDQYASSSGGRHHDQNDRRFYNNRMYSILIHGQKQFKKSTAIIIIK